jgi:HPt (histidine-containing phosphotransfer) domain-containing protein
VSDNPYSIDLAQALSRLGGSHSLFAAVALRFATDAPSVVDAATDLANNGEWWEVGLRMHTLKGMSGTVGATAVVHAAAELELQCMRDKRIDHGEEALGRLRQQVEAAIVALKTIIEQLPRP